MTWYARGKPGQAPLFSRNAGIITGVADDQVVVRVDDLPENEVKISQDGKSLEEITPDPDVVMATRWQMIRDRRNNDLNDWSWTFRSDSPLSSDCQKTWLEWAQTMNRITIDYKDPDSVKWPDHPDLIYS